MSRQAIALVLLSASLPLSAETFRARATASGAMNGTSYADAWALTGANSIVWASMMLPEAHPLDIIECTVCLV